MDLTLLTFFNRLQTALPFLMGLTCFAASGRLEPQVKRNKETSPFEGIHWAWQTLGSPVPFFSDYDISYS